MLMTVYCCTRFFLAPDVNNGTTFAVRAIQLTRPALLSQLIKLVRCLPHIDIDRYQPSILQTETEYSVSAIDRALGISQLWQKSLSIIH